MSVRLKLLVIVLFVAMVPISVSAWISLRIHQRAFERNLASLHQVVASREAERVHMRLRVLEESFQRLATGTLSWDELSENEQQAALWLLYRSNDDVVAVTLLDADRRLLTRPAYLTAASVNEEPTHLAAPESIVAGLLGHLPSQTSGSDTTYGEPFLVSAAQAPILPISVPLHTGGSGHGPSSLAIGVSLRTLCRSEPRPTDIEISVLDSAMRRLCASPRFPPLSPTMPDSSVASTMSPRHQKITTEQAGSLPGSEASVVTYTAEDGKSVLSARAVLPHGWQVVAEQPVAVAYAASLNMRRQAILWTLISVAIALASGLILSRSISEPVQRLVTGVRELAQGRWEHRIEPLENDELGNLGQAFNQMAAELSARDAEIREWNAVLQEKVRERTLAIEQYHQNLLQAEKSAAVARLTAGVAAEINDPLTGILGAVQLLATRARVEPKKEQEARLLDNAEEGALRIRELIKRVQALGQRQPRSQLRSVAVQDLVVSALGLLEATLAAADANIQVVRLSTGTIPMVLGNFTQLEQALLQVLTNAVAACCAASQPNDSAPATDGSQPASPRRKGRILVQTQCVERRAVSIAVSDDGIGIRETELENVFEPFVALRADSGPGLGLTIARRIIEEHGGKIWAESNEATGTTVCIQLPTAEGSAA